MKGKRTRRRITIALLTALATMAIPATARATTSAPGTAAVPAAAARSLPLGRRPTGVALSGAGAVITGSMTDHGGPVENAPQVYVDYWHWTSDPSGEQPYLNKFLSAVGSSSWLATVQQYGGGWTGQLLAGTWADPNPVPSQPTKAQIQAEAAVAASHFGVGNSDNVQIIVATPTGHSMSSFPSLCAYHGTVSADPNITYTYLPYMTDGGVSCGEDSVNGSNGTLDGVSIFEGHELAETITDPLLNAWYDSGGHEIGDKCAWSGLADMRSSEGTFAVQSLWSNFANGCVQSPATPLTGVLTGNTVLAKAGSLAAKWNQEDFGVAQVAVATNGGNGPLIGVVTTGGVAYATEGLLNKPTHEYTGVKEIAVASDPVNGPLIGVVTTGGEAYVKEGGLSTTWVHEYSGVSHLALASSFTTGPLIGVVTTDGKAFVKEGGLSAPWTHEYNGVSQIALAGSAAQGPVISILTTGGVAYTKDGGLSTTWVHEYTGVSRIAVAADDTHGPLIGVVTTGGVAYVKEGGLSATWTHEQNNVSQLSLGSNPHSGPMIGVLVGGNVAYVKQGGLSATWTHEYTGASQIATAS